MKPVRICPACFGGKFRRRYLPLRSQMEWVCAQCHPPEEKADWRCPACRCPHGILVQYQGSNYRQCRECGYFATARTQAKRNKP